MHRIRSMLLLGCLLSNAVQAQTVQEPARESRLRLRETRLDTAPEHGGRYTVRGRISPVASAGELREGDNFVLIGRFAKAGVGCGPAGDSIFRDGFEG